MLIRIYVTNPTEEPNVRKKNQFMFTHCGTVDLMTQFLHMQIIGKLKLTIHSHLHRAKQREKCAIYGTDYTSKQKTVSHFSFINKGEETSHVLRI